MSVYGPTTRTSTLTRHREAIRERISRDRSWSTLLALRDPCQSRSPRESSGVSPISRYGLTARSVPERRAGRHRAARL
jgi:hypothetical protein